eukprot:11163712-Lingulodinium_polyedra.AAC.1
MIASTHDGNQRILQTRPLLSPTPTMSPPQPTTYANAGNDDQTHLFCRLHQRAPNAAAPLAFRAL